MRKQAKQKATLRFFDARAMTYSTPLSPFIEVINIIRRWNIADCFLYPACSNPVKQYLSYLVIPSRSDLNRGARAQGTELAQLASKIGEATFGKAAPGSANLDAIAPWPASAAVQRPRLNHSVSNGTGMARPLRSVEIR